MVLDYEHTGNKRTLTQPIENWNILGDAVAESHAAATAATTRMDAIEATIAQFGLVGYRNLLVIPGPTPTTQVALSAGVLAVEGSIPESMVATVDITIAGKNGLDTGTRTTNTWYHLWAGYNPTTEEACGLWSLQIARAALTLSHASLVGFTKWRRVGVRRTNATSGGQLLQVHQQDNVCLYETDLTVFTGSAGTGDAAFVAAQLGSGATAANQWVPAHCRHALVTCSMTGTGASGGQTMVRPTGGTTTVGRRLAQVGASVDSGMGTSWVATNGAQALDWAATNPSSVSLFVTGYYDPIG